MKIRVGKSVLATLTRFLQMVDKVRLRKADVRSGWSVQVPEVPSGVWLASEGALFS